MDWDDAYANAPYIPDADSYPPRWRREAEAFRGKLAEAGRARIGIRYGTTTRSVMDMFLPSGTPAGLMVFVHGGYWMKFEGLDWSHLAGGAVERGWAVAMPTYDLCPDVRIADITRQVASAITQAAAEIAGPIRLTGHSAGGHLVARMLAPGVLPTDVLSRIERAVPISPVSDLRPLMNTAMNETLRIDADEAARESPALHEKPETPVIVWVGGQERPVFLDQAQWLADAWDAEIFIAPTHHHFNVIEGLVTPLSGLTTAVFQ